MSETNQTPTLRGTLSRLISSIRSLSFLNSRKNRVAIAAALGGIAAKWGLDLGDEVMYSIVVLGCAVIWGIATEDAGAKSQAKPPTNPA